MPLTPQELNRATLARQLLLERTDLGVTDAARHVVAMQGQHAASPYLALWNRVEDLDAGVVDSAFAEGRMVKATLMRITLHVVHADDHASFHTAMQPTLRAARLNDRRYTDTGLTRRAVRRGRSVSDRRTSRLTSRSPHRGTSRSPTKRWSGWKAPMAPSCTTCPARPVRPATSRRRRDCWRCGTASCSPITTAAG